MTTPKIRCTVSFNIEIDAPFAYDYKEQAPRLKPVQEIMEAFRAEYGNTPDCILDSAKTEHKTPTYDLKVQILEGQDVVAERTTTEEW